MRPRFPLARKLLLTVGAGSLAVYTAIFIVEARMGRLLTLDLLGRFAEDFLGSRAARIDGELRAAEALARTLAAALPAVEADPIHIGRLLCGAVAAPLHQVTLVLAPPSPGAGPRGWSCVLEGGKPRLIDPLVAGDGLAELSFGEEARGRSGGAWASSPATATAGAGVLAHSLPVLEGEDASRRQRGQIRIEISVGPLVRSLRPVRGTLFLLSASGSVLVPPAPALPGPGASSVMETVGARVSAERGDRGFYQDSSPGQTGSSWIAYRRIPSSGGWLVAAVPEDAILRELNDLRLRLLGLMLLGALVLLAVTAALARGITRPVTSLASATHRIAGGDLESAVPITGSRDEVGDLARSFEEMRVSLRHHIAKAESLAAARARMEGDLRVAREIQLGLLPTDFAQVTRGFPADLFAMVVPAREVGGDLYDAFRLDERRACLVIGDVSGKGIPASLFMTATRTLVRALAQETRGPAELLARVNDVLAAENPRSMFVTAFCAVVDLAAGNVAYANAGHLPPAIVPPSGPARFAHAAPGLPLGLMPGAAYEDTELTLARGDTLLLYTDGVTEALDVAQRLLEPEGLLARLDAGPRGSARETVEDVLACVRAFAGEAPQSDDIGLLALRMEGPAAPDA